MDRTVQDKLKDFFTSYPTVDYQKGEIITHANEEPQGILFVLSGVIEQYDITPEGNRLTVNIFKPPAFFPMSWAINKTPNAYFYEALTDVSAKRASADEVVQFLHAHPDVVYDLMSRVYRGTDALLRRLVLAASGIASSRLVYELLIEAYRFGVDVDKHKKCIEVKQTTLAARSGLARETVSRELHKLEKDNLITLTKQGIVFDINLLERKLNIDV